MVKTKPKDLRINTKWFESFDKLTLIKKQSIIKIDNYENIEIKPSLLGSQSVKEDWGEGISYSKNYLIRSHSVKKD